MKKMIIFMLIIGTLISFTGCFLIDDSKVSSGNDNSKEINIPHPSVASKVTTSNFPIISDNIENPCDEEELEDRYYVNLKSEELLDFFNLDIKNESEIEAFLEKHKDPDGSTYEKFENAEQVRLCYNQFYNFGIVPFVNEYSLVCDCTIFHEPFGTTLTGDVDVNYFWINGNKLYAFKVGSVLDENESYLDFTKRGVGYEPELVYQIEDQKMQVYRRRMCEEWPETIVEYSIVIGRRWFILAYRDKDAESVRNYPVEEILQDVEFLSIGDVNWSDLTLYDDREKGDINKTEAVSIAQAELEKIQQEGMSEEFALNSVYLDTKEQWVVCFIKGESILGNRYHVAVSLKTGEVLDQWWG